MEYEDAIRLVGEIESASTQAESVIIDPGSALRNSIQEKAYSYEDAYRIISSMEGVKAQPQATVQQQPQQIQHARPAEAAVKAAEEIRKLVGKASAEFEESMLHEMRKVKVGKLILPTLSLQDQLSELEKINEGLDENVFNDEQLKVIRQEVFGLAETLRYEKPKSLDAFQASLAAMRAKRLEEAEARLSNMK
ncbi:MAG: hypothetical protein QXE33_00240 [Candidatus Micrarchaeaceae archaeon]